MIILICSRFPFLISGACPSEALDGSPPWHTEGGHGADSEVSNTCLKGMGGSIALPARSLESRLVRSERQWTALPRCLWYRIRRHSSSLIILVRHLHHTMALMATMREEHCGHVYSYSMGCRVIQRSLLCPLWRSPRSGGGSVKVCPERPSWRARVFCRRLYKLTRRRG